MFVNRKLQQIVICAECESSSFLYEGWFHKLLSYIAASDGVFIVLRIDAFLKALLFWKYSGTATFFSPSSSRNLSNISPPWVSVCHCHSVSKWSNNELTHDASGAILLRTCHLSFSDFFLSEIFSFIISGAGCPIKNNESSFSCLCPWPERS